MKLIPLFRYLLVFDTKLVEGIALCCGRCLSVVVICAATLKWDCLWHGSLVPVFRSIPFLVIQYFGISVSAGSGIAVSILTRLSVVVMDVVTLRCVRSVPFDAGLYRFWFFNISVFRFCGYAYPAWFRSLPSSSSSSSFSGVRRRSAAAGRSLPPSGLSAP